jgi:murein DD-endopeptidase MepM/ murein hydrolase activator NlpD
MLTPLFFSGFLMNTFAPVSSGNKFHATVRRILWFRITRGHVIDAKARYGLRFTALFLAMLLTSYAAPMHGQSLPVDKPYGGPAPYGDGRHPGIDYGIPIGTPVVAASGGRVVLLIRTDGDNSGETVGIGHERPYMSTYGHLSKVFVTKGQLVKRGELIGLSGASNNFGARNYSHLHFGICNVFGRDCRNFSESYDPQLFWLGGEPQCFNPGLDYSAYSRKEITLPIACETLEKIGIK